MASFNAEQVQANFGDIMQASSGDNPIPPQLEKALSRTDWMQGDPILRLVLTSNATLQRIMSAWYQDKVTVRVCFNNEITEGTQWDTSSKQYDRRVEISCRGRVFCVATSRVILTDKKAIEAVESCGIGIAQLYHHFKILPHFHLTDADGRGPAGEQVLWREYVLDGHGIECRIREDFRPRFLEYTGDEANGNEPPTKLHRSLSGPTPHLGDLMKGTSCVNTLDAEIAIAAHPLQRVLLTATGNVVRILASYHKKPIFVGVLRSCPVKTGVYERVVLMYCEHKAICRARTLVTVSDAEIVKEVQNGTCDLGGVFRKFNLLPTFELQRVDIKPSDAPGFGRHYYLKAQGICCEVFEEFSDIVLHLSDNSPESNAMKGIPKIFPESDAGQVGA